MSHLFRGGPSHRLRRASRPQADGDLPATRAALEAALAIDAAYVPAALGLARLLRQPGPAQDLTLAAAHVAGALRAQPDSATAWCSSIPKPYCWATWPCYHGSRIPCSE